MEHLMKVLGVVLLLSSSLISAQRPDDEKIIESRFNANLIFYLDRVLNAFNCNLCRATFGWINYNKCNVVCSGGGGTPTTAVPTTTTLPPCPKSEGSTFKVFTIEGKYYAFSTSRATFEVAKKACADRGMHLATFETEAEYLAALTSIGPISGSTTGYRAWIGMIGTGTTPPLTYNWIYDGSLVSIGWIPTATASKNYPCGVMEDTSEPSGLDSEPCTTSYPYVCEMEACV